MVEFSTGGDRRANFFLPPAQTQSPARIGREALTVQHFSVAVLLLFPAANADHSVFSRFETEMEHLWRVVIRVL